MGTPQWSTCSVEFFYSSFIGYGMEWKTRILSPNEKLCSFCGDWPVNQRWFIHRQGLLFYRTRHVLQEQTLLSGLLGLTQKNIRSRLAITTNLWSHNLISIFHAAVQSLVNNNSWSVWTADYLRKIIWNNTTALSLIWYNVRERLKIAFIWCT